MLYCPRAYKFQYDDRIQTRKEPHFFAVGSAVEEAVNAYLLARDSGRDIGVEGILGVFDQIWKLEVEERPKKKKEIDWKKEDPKKMKAKIRNLVGLFPKFGAPYIKKVYRTQARLSVDQPLGLSRDFFGIVDFIADVYVPRDCVPCKGTGDILVPQKTDPKKKKKAPCGECGGSGTRPSQVAVLAVVDLKTAGSAWGKLQATADSQATEYVWTCQKQPESLCEELGEAVPTHAGYLVGVKTTAAPWQFLLREPSPFDFMEVEASLRAHEALVKSGERPKNPGYSGRNCDWCDFRSLCWEPEKAGETLILRS